MAGRSRVGILKSSRVDSWTCSVCTYINGPLQNICAVCDQGVAPAFTEVAEERHRSEQRNPSRKADLHIYDHGVEEAKLGSVVAASHSPPSPSPRRAHRLGKRYSSGGSIDEATNSNTQGDFSFATTVTDTATTHDAQLDVMDTQDPHGATENAARVAKLLRQGDGTEEHGDPPEIVAAREWCNQLESPVDTAQLVDDSLHALKHSEFRLLRLKLVGVYNDATDGPGIASTAASFEENDPYRPTNVLSTRKASFFKSNGTSAFVDMVFSSHEMEKDTGLPKRIGLSLIGLQVPSASTCLSARCTPVSFAAVFAVDSLDELSSLDWCRTMPLIDAQHSQRSSRPVCVARVDTPSHSRDMHWLQYFECSRVSEPRRYLVLRLLSPNALTLTTDVTSSPMSKRKHRKQLSSSANLVSRGIALMQFTACGRVQGSDIADNSFFSFDPLVFENLKKIQSVSERRAVAVYLQSRPTQHRASESKRQEQDFAFCPEPLHSILKQTIFRSHWKGNYSAALDAASDMRASHGQLTAIFCGGLVHALASRFKKAIFCFESVISRAKQSAQPVVPYDTSAAPVVDADEKEPRTTLPTSSPENPQLLALRSSSYLLWCRLANAAVLPNGELADPSPNTDAGRWMEQAFGTNGFDSFAAVQRQQRAAFATQLQELCGSDSDQFRIYSLEEALVQEVLCSVPLMNTQDDTKFSYVLNTFRMSILSRLKQQGQAVLHDSLLLSLSRYAREVGEMGESQALFEEVAQGALSEQHERAVCCLFTGDTFFCPPGTCTSLPYVWNMRLAQDVGELDHDVPPKLSQNEMCFAASVPQDPTSTDTSASGNSLRTNVEQQHGSALQLFAQAGSARGMGVALLRLCYLFMVEKDYIRSCELCHLAVALFEKEGDSAGEMMGRTMAIAVAVAARSSDLNTMLGEAFSIGAWGAVQGSSAETLGMGIFLSRLGYHWAGREGDPERAMQCFSLAEEVFLGLGAHCSVVRSWCDRAKLLSYAGLHNKAALLYENALEPLRERMSLAPNADAAALGWRALATAFIKLVDTVSNWSCSIEWLPDISVAFDDLCQRMPKSMSSSQAHIIDSFQRTAIARHRRYVLETLITYGLQLRRGRSLTVIPNRSRTLSPTLSTSAATAASTAMLEKLYSGDWRVILQEAVRLAEACGSYLHRAFALAELGDKEAAIKSFTHEQRADGMEDARSLMASWKLTTTHDRLWWQDAVAAKFFVRIGDYERAANHLRQFASEPHNAIALSVEWDMLCVQGQIMEHTGVNVVRETGSKPIPSSGTAEAVPLTALSDALDLYIRAVEVLDAAGLYGLPVKRSDDVLSGVPHFSCRLLPVRLAAKMSKLYAAQGDKEKAQALSERCFHFAEQARQAWERSSLSPHSSITSESESPFNRLKLCIGRVAMQQALLKECKEQQSRDLSEEKAMRSVNAATVSRLQRMLWDAERGMKQVRKDLKGVLQAFPMAEFDANSVTVEAVKARLQPKSSIPRHLTQTPTRPSSSRSESPVRAGSPSLQERLNSPRRRAGDSHLKARQLPSGCSSPTVVLCFLYHDADLFVFPITSQGLEFGMHHLQQDGITDRINSLSHQFVKQLSTQRSSANSAEEKKAPDADAVRALSELLLWNEPVSKALAYNESVITVGWSDASSIPFSSLLVPPKNPDDFKSSSGQTLASTHSVCCMPSPGLLSNLESFTRKNLLRRFQAATAGKATVALGRDFHVALELPDLRGHATRGSGEVTAATEVHLTLETELRESPSTDVFVVGPYDTAHRTASSLLEQMSKPAVLHLAPKAISPSYTRIWNVQLLECMGDAGPGSSAVCFGDLLTRGLDVGLVVLDFDISEQCAVVARAILAAGAQACLVRLWPIPPLPKLLLLDAFYRGLENGNSPPFSALETARHFLRDMSANDVRAAQKRFVPIDQNINLELAKPFASEAFWAGWMLFSGPQ